ncbi:THC0290_0291 family protein [Winogradskyella bathintestinalis]|uniref:Glutamate dehydrogenase n=1 Tax=Winogradskyella bathintestinalis TaxID=3035208 RepID=A0ABT7ZRY5_9FLAO|nr:glutamate dehydrogenase [Winogradskyella bathintestinalis]MDN3491762.1 glutamate dehydrogenase [Winogradskyella bathintestinalis]
MKLDLKKLITLFVLLLSLQLSYSQLGFSHEVGVITGPVAFQSDFGERYDFETNSGNTGFGIGLVYFMNFDYLTNYYYSSANNYFTDHFKIRAEISWNKTKLNHFGKWVDTERTGPSADKLRAHSGESQNWNLGAQLEYYPLSIKAFSQGAFSLTPFGSVGIQYVSFNPTVNTTYGDQNFENPNNFYPLWEPGSIDDKGGSTWSAVASLGARYKLTVLSDLMIDLRFQQFFHDSVDGLDHQLASNKANDWLLWLNFGYIYYFD